MKTQEVIITSFGNVTPQGLSVETNIPAKLKTGHLRSKSFWLSWDKIGQNLFEDYTERSEVAELNELRGSPVKSQSHSLPEKERIGAILNSYATIKGLKTKVINDTQFEAIADEILSSQPEAKESNEVTDLMIEKWAAGKVNEIDPEEYAFGDLLIIGARWMRSQMNKNNHASENSLY